MLKRIPTLKGLNLRDSDINRPPDYAQDCRNVEKNSKGEVVLRWGYDKILDDNGIIDLFEYVGAEDSPNRGSLLALKNLPSDGIFKWDGTTLNPVPTGNIGGQPTWTSKTRSVEYNKVLYWNDPEFNVDLWKYDGYSTYRAGVPAPIITNDNYSGSTPGTAHYFRVILKYSDPQGNVTYSDYATLEGDNEYVSFDIQPNNSSDYDGFYQKYAKFKNRFGLSFYINSGSLTLTGIDSHNYDAGDFIVAQLGTAPSGEETFTRVLEVESVTPTSITFTSASVGTGSYLFKIESNLAPAEKRWEVLVYRSGDQFSNYIECDLFEVSDDGGTTLGDKYSFQATGSLLNITTFDTNGNNLQDIYDDSLVRVLPPRSKYLTIYGEQIFLGNIDRDNDAFGYSSLLGNDSRLEDSIVWSDVATLSNGSSVETFLVNNIRAIGNSEDGALVGLHGNDDNLAVHKEKQSYYVNGDFISNNLRIRRAMTEQIGTASHRSIRTVEGGHLYVSPKGVYLSVGGQRPSELSDLIEPLFTDNALELEDTLNTKKAKTITDFLREKMYIFIPYTTVDTGGIVLSYDYYHKDWFVHDNIPADRGFQDVGIASTDIYFADKEGLYKRNLNSRKDNDKKTVGYYWTGWFDLDFPSIVKKFTNFILLSIAKKDFTATIKGYCNWQKDTEESSNTVELTDKISSEDTQVLQVQANSVSYRISNESNGSDLHITSYEVEYEPTQTKPKGTV